MLPPSLPAAHCLSRFSNFVDARRRHRADGNFISVFGSPLLPPYAARKPIASEGVQWNPGACFLGLASTFLAPSVEKLCRNFVCSLLKQIRCRATRSKPDRILSRQGQARRTPRVATLCGTSNRVPESSRRCTRPRKRQDTVKAVDTSYPPFGDYYLANILASRGWGRTTWGCVSMPGRRRTLRRGGRLPPGAQLS